MKKRNWHPQPWRKVLHIEHRTGPRGGDFYWLTLECGHHFSTRSRDGASAAWWRKITYAPHKVKCFFCQQVEPGKRKAPE